MQKLKILLFICLCLFVGTMFYSTQAPTRSRSLNDSARLLAAQLTVNLAKNNYQPPSGHIKPVVFISRNYFIDPHKETIYPFSNYLCVELQTALTETGQFDVIDGADYKPDLFVTCAYYQERDQLNITCQLRGDVADPGRSRETVFAGVAGARDTINRKYWSAGWFEEDTRDKMFFLMQKIEEKSFNQLFILKDKPQVVVNKLRFQDSPFFSPFSDYISQYALDYFTKSNLLIPKTDVAKTLSAFRSTKTRNIVPVSTKQGSMAAMTQASHYIEGSYWKVSDDAIEVRCLLANLNGDTLASESIRIETRLINPDWLEIPQTQNARLFSDLNAPLPTRSNSSLAVELFTQKGRDNLVFVEGEEIIFLIKASQPAFIRLFNQGADGIVYQIYPNTFDADTRQIEAHQVVAIPNDQYQDGFVFKVQGALGNEVVLAFASSAKLPELANTDVHYFGLKQMHLTLPQIKAAYSEHSLKYGIALASDFIPVRTRK